MPRVPASTFDDGPSVESGSRRWRWRDCRPEKRITQQGKSATHAERRADAVGRDCNVEEPARDGGLAFSRRGTPEVVFESGPTHLSLLTCSAGPPRFQWMLCGANVCVYSTLDFRDFCVYSEPALSIQNIPESRGCPGTALRKPGLAFAAGILPFQIPGTSCRDYNSLIRISVHPLPPGHMVAAAQCCYVGKKRKIPLRVTSCYQVVRRSTESIHFQQHA